jgi:hypothetical protein
MERNVKKEIAELLAKIGVVAAVDRLEDFRDFFDQAIAQAKVRLFAVPRATIGCAETGGCSEQKVDAGHAQDAEGRKERSQNDCQKARERLL